MFLILNGLFYISCYWRLLGIVLRTKCYSMKCCFCNWFFQQTFLTWTSKDPSGRIVKSTLVKSSVTASAPASLRAVLLWVVLQAMTWAPAAWAAFTPAGASSNTITSSGLKPSSSTARKYPSGCGLLLVTYMTQNYQLSSLTTLSTLDFTSAKLTISPQTKTFGAANLHWSNIFFAICELQLV